LLEFVREPTWPAQPRYSAPGATEWKEVSWDWTLDCVARNFEDGWDKNLVAINAGGITVHRWLLTGFRGIGRHQETGWISFTAVRGTKLIVIDPHFTCTAAVGDFYPPIRRRTHITSLPGMIGSCSDDSKVR